MGLAQGVPQEPGLCARRDQQGPIGVLRESLEGEGSEDRLDPIELPFLQVMPQRVHIGSAGPRSVYRRDFDGRDALHSHGLDVPKVRERHEASREAERGSDLGVSDREGEVVPKAAEVVEGCPDREMGRGFDAMVERDASQEGRGLRPHVLEDELAVGSCLLILRGRRDGLGFPLHAFGGEGPLLQAEVIEDEESKEAEASRRTREPQEVATRLDREDTVRRVDLRIVVIRDDREESLKNRRRVCRIFDQVIEELDPLPVFEGGEEREKAIEVLQRHANGNVALPFRLRASREGNSYDKGALSIDTVPPPYDVIVLGSGPAGLTAAIYATRAGLKTLVIAGVPAGGQLTTTTDVENYPGFPAGVQGPELMELWRKQTERFDANIIDDNVSKVDFQSHPFKVWTSDGIHEARSIIVATGANARYLGLPNEERLKGRGVSACATCDGFFFKSLNVAVVGGGDTAMEESLYLSKLCKTVHVVHRRNAFRASKIMQDRLFKTPNIKVIWDSEVVDVLGESKVEGVRIKNVKTGKTSELKVEGLFLAIGHEPATDFLRGQLELDRGYVVLKPRDGMATATSVDGVFAAGDVHDLRYRQAVTAAGFGSMAALDAERWLQESGR
jgi:thioredoxin reductase (NADPH)